MNSHFLETLDMCIESCIRESDGIRSSWHASLDLCILLDDLSEFALMMTHPVS